MGDRVTGWQGDGTSRAPLPPSPPSPPERSATPFVVDADIHVNDTPGALAPYCDQPWRMSLEALAGPPSPTSMSRATRPNLKLDPPIPGGHAYRSVAPPAEMRAGLTELGIDAGILFPDHLLLFAAIPNIEYATALAHAYNRWLVAEWLPERARPLRRDAGLSRRTRRRRPREIAELRARTQRSSASTCRRPASTRSGATAATTRSSPRRRRPTCRSCLHSVTLVSPAFPCQLDQFENHFARQVLSHSFAMMANLDQPHAHRRPGALPEAAGSSSPRRASAGCRT